MKKLPFNLGLVGPFLFIALSVIASLITPNYSMLRSPISNLAILQYGWIQTLNFGLTGICVLILGLTLWNLLKDKTKAPIFVIYFGIILVLSAIFRTDPDSPHTITGIIHILLFVTGVIGLIISGFMFAKVFWKDQRILSIYSFIKSITSTIFFIGIFVTHSYMGLAQRLLIYPIFIWIFVLSLTTYNKYNKA